MPSVVLASVLLDCVGVADYRLSDLFVMLEAETYFLLEALCRRVPLTNSCVALVGWRWGDSQGAYEVGVCSIGGFRRLVIVKPPCLLLS